MQGIFILVYIHVCKHHGPTEPEQGHDRHRHSTSEPKFFLSILQRYSFSPSFVFNKMLNIKKYSVSRKFIYQWSNMYTEKKLTYIFIDLRSSSSVMGQLLNIYNSPSNFQIWYKTPLDKEDINYKCQDFCTPRAWGQKLTNL